MRLIDRLLQRPRVSTPVAPAGAGSLAPVEPPDATETATVAPLPLPRPPVALQSLTRYQHDPAFAQFQQKMHRPRGLPQPRARLRPDDYPPRPPKPPA